MTISRELLAKSTGNFESGQPAKPDRKVIRRLDQKNRALFERGSTRFVIEGSIDDMRIRRADQENELVNSTIDGLLSI